MRAAKVQASLRIRAVSPEPPLLAHTSNESRGTFRQKARSLASLNGWACAVKICHDGMLEDTNSLDGAHLLPKSFVIFIRPGQVSELPFCLRSNLLFFLHTRPGFPWTRPGLGNVVLNGGGGVKMTLVHDVSMTIWRHCWRHFHVSFRQLFRHQRTREEPYRTFLDRKM